MWANTVWGFLGLSATLGVAIMGLSPDYAYLRPWFSSAAIVFFLASLITLCWPLRNRSVRASVLAYCRHPTALVRKLEPTHLIAIGIGGAVFFAVVALVGLIWQSRIALPPPTLPVAASQTAPVRAAGPAAVPVQKPLTFTPHEYDARSRALSELYDYVNGPVRELFLKFHTASSEIESRIGNSADTTARLNKLQTELIESSNNLAKIVRRWDEFQDIRFMTDWNFTRIIQANMRFLQSMPPQNTSGEMYYFFIMQNKERPEWKESIGWFSGWIEDTKTAIRKKRAEYHDAEIIK
jgi:hypothetical protein